ncbi:gamma-aminobutyric acid type B receptor subunit 2-like [Asterias amurensis]|uniref:gamma-aminobutyric acid type B receptor subunit 2-like n=1 Tax=Asterias amurensis TaxID=7602 RepID=UPI003AB5C9D2
MTGSWAAGGTLEPATRLAVNDINADDGILPGFQIEMLNRDTACDGGKATDVMYEELYNRSTHKIMIIGGGCSVCSEATAQASHHWNLIQVSYSSSSPTLSNRKLFPRFFRLLSPESVYNIVKLAMCREFKWMKVATLHESVTLFSQAMTDFHTEARKLGIEILGAESFVGDPKSQVDNIKKLGARIIIGGFYTDKARKVFCEAYHQQMFGAKYVWIVPGWYESNWWKVADDSIDCTEKEMEGATNGLFGYIFESSPSEANRRPSVSGLTSSELIERYQDLTGHEDIASLIGYNRITSSYDIMWMAALALHATHEILQELDPPKSIADFAYDRETVEILFDVISNMTFEGVSGPVKFTSTGDRLGFLQLRQIQDGIDVPVGVVDTISGTGDRLIWEGYQPIVWQGGAPPIDFMIEKEDRQTIQLPVFITGTIFSVIGMSLAVCFLVFNVKFRKIRVIKMSSPNINNVMLVGGILAYISIIFLGIDTNITSKEIFVWMCKAKTWFLAIGFSMAFGSMFSKTWRVHKIFTHSTKMKMRVRDQWLLISVAVLITLDAAILILWEIIDPITVTEQHGTKVIDEDNDDIVYTPIRTTCESIHQIYWIGAFYIIDGLLLVFGAFLAWETRKVSIPALNDSKYIGICVYNVLILSFICAPVSFVLEERNVNYVLVATTIWLATTLTLCVVFIPKIKMRNEVQPARNQLVTTTQPSTILTGEHSKMDSQTEVQHLRKELLRYRSNCRCSTPLGGNEPSFVQSTSAWGNTEHSDVGVAPAGVKK